MIVKLTKSDLKRDVIILLLIGICYVLDHYFPLQTGDDTVMAFWNLVAVGAHSIRGAIEGKHRQKKLDKQIKKMPKYQITPEAFQIVSQAMSEYYGRNRDIQMAQQDVDKDVSTATSQAKDVTDSTSGILSALSNISQSGMESKRDLAKYESGELRRAAGERLLGAKQFMIDEKDKAWYQNVYAPWETKFRQMQAYDANRSAQSMAETSALGSSAFSGGGGGDGDGSIKKMETVRLRKSS